MKGFGLADIISPQGSKSSSREKIQNVSGSLATVVKIPLDRCFEGNFQPRSYITEDAIVAMANSIENEGQHQPVIVYIKGNAHQNIKKNDYYVVSGHTRLEACRRLGKTSIDAIVYTNINKALIASVTTNEVSTSLHVVDKGTAMQSLLDSGAFSTQEELAKYFNCSQGLISRYLGYNVLPKAIKSKLVEYNITNKTFLNKLRKLFKNQAQIKMSTKEKEEFFFDVVTDIESYSLGASSNKIGDNSVPTNFTNFLYMKNGEDIVIRERALKKLTLSQKRMMLDTLEKMKDILL